MGSGGRWGTVLGVALGACALVSGCASYDPFKIPAEQLRDRVDTVAVPPLAVEPDLAEPERMRAWIEPRVVEMLEEGGFDVVPPEEWERRWLAIAQQVGEIWDPVSGARDPERYATVLSALRHQLAVERGVDAILRLSLYSVELEGGPRSQQLCGTIRDLYWPGDRLGIAERATVASGACLQASAYDLDDREIYGIRHGLEFVETYARQTHAIRPLDERLRDRTRMEEAVDAIVGPLARQGRK